MQAMTTMAQVVLIDNYDSFTHNIVHALETVGAQCTVVSHDHAAAPELVQMPADGWVISAGPCTPDESMASFELAKLALTRPLPLLGICLGHQCIAQAAGARLRRATRPMHGKTAHIDHDGRGVLSELSSPLLAARYNSLVVDTVGWPDELEQTAWDEDGDVMGLRHRSLPIEGVQFHPESHLSEGGAQLLRNWIAGLARRPHSD